MRRVGGDAPNQGVSFAIGDVCLKTTNIKWQTAPADKTYSYIDLSTVSIEFNQIVDSTDNTKL